MKKHALLIDYEYCTGCHTCEVACQQEHSLEPDKLGIEIKKIGPTYLGNRKWQYDFIPTPTALCDLCSDRVSKGKKPSCVHHCQSNCMEYGTVEDLAKKVTRSKMVIFS